MLLLVDICLTLFFLKIYLFIHETHRQREKQAPAGSLTRDWIPDPGISITPEPEAGAQPLSHPGIPLPDCNKNFAYLGGGK